MLVLSRKVGEKIVVGENITIEVVRVKGNRVVLGLLAPADIKIMREELKDKPLPEHAEQVTMELIVEDGLLVAC